jgi:hypothetical protein
LLAQAGALGEVDEHGFGKECFPRPARGPLELIVALGHVLDQVFHPQ